MKKIFFLFFVIAFVTPGNIKAQVKYHNGNSLSINVKINDVKVNDTTVFISLHAVILNVSTDTVYYAIMKCNWQDSYIVNSKDLELDHYPCKDDKVIIEMLPPQNHIDYWLSLNPTKPFPKLKKKKYKIGFNAVIVTNTPTDVYPAAKIKSINNIIWSNTFTLQRKPEAGIK